MKSLFLLIAVILFGCNQTPDQKASNQFSGLWKLHVMERLDTVSGEWVDLNTPIQGYILYDEKDNMAVHLTAVGYENTDLRFPNFNDSIPIEALKHLTNSYVYFAKYTVDEERRTVEHARLSHSNPGQWNDVVDRKFNFSGDTLTLEPLDAKVPERLVWIKDDSGK